jgi:hypothetical protein
MGVALALKNFEDDEKETNLQPVAETVAKQVNQSVHDSIELMRQRNRRENLERYGCDCPAAKCYPTCPRIMLAQESAVIFEYLARTKPPDNREREVMPPGRPSGKSSSRSKRKRKKNPTFRNLFMET